MVPTHLWVFDRAVNVSSKEKQEHYLKAVGILQKKKGKIDIKCSRLDIFLASDPEGMTLCHLFRQKNLKCIVKGGMQAGKRGNCQKPPPLTGMCCLWLASGAHGLKRPELNSFFIFFQMSCCIKSPLPSFSLTDLWRSVL